LNITNVGRWRYPLLNIPDHLVWFRACGGLVHIVFCCHETNLQFIQVVVLDSSWNLMLFMSSMYW
jgi:hypothetical protein